MKMKLLKPLSHLLTVWPEDLKKIGQNFLKVAQTVSKAKTGQNIYHKKARNIYIKPLLKPYTTCNKPCFETAYFGENVVN